jgi:hypothetical protein
LKSSDPLDPPKIFANYLDEERDIKALVEGIRFAIQLSETQALKAYGMELDKKPVPACESFEFGSQVSFSFVSKVVRLLNLNLILGLLGMCRSPKYGRRKPSSWQLQNGTSA